MGHHHRGAAGLHDPRQPPCCQAERAAGSRNGRCSCGKRLIKFDFSSFFSPSCLRGWGVPGPAFFEGGGKEIKPEIKEEEVITEEPKQVVEPKPIEAPTVKSEPINFEHNLDKNEELSPISNTKTDFNDFNKSDIDTLLANLLGSNNKEEETQEVKEAKTEEVKPLPKVEIPKEPSVEPIKEEPIINNSEILEEVPQYNPNASLRDLLYNPQNANIKENNNVFINEDLINKEKDNYLKSAISSPVKEEPVKEEIIKEEPIKKEVKPVTNEVINSDDKPIINVKPDDIKIDDNISDDEFFDDFFGED